ncbi:hypothetical protein SUGI_0621750 [Cryptomeria japonica]|nr:hypothetical protein SUGI_0621750 [Cryptomeria japonica]
MQLDPQSKSWLRLHLIVWWDGVSKDVPETRSVVQPGVVKCKVLEVDWDYINEAGKRENLADTSQNHYPRDCEAGKPEHSKQFDHVDGIDLSKIIEEYRLIFKKHTIIARFVGPKLPRKDVRIWVDNNWGNHVVIKFLSKGFFVAVFAEVEERAHILQSQNWFMNKHPLYIQSWAPNFGPTPLAIYEKPVWIRLYNLPTEYWSDSSLEDIGRTMGTLLEIDKGILALTYIHMQD